MRLKELRKAAGKTQADIAELIGVTRGAYTNIENGKRETDTASLCVLADYFNVSVDYLLGREKEKSPPPNNGDGLDPLDQRLNELLSQATEDTKQAMIVLLEQTQKP